MSAQKPTPGPWKWRPMFDGENYGFDIWELIGADGSIVADDGSAGGEYSKTIEPLSPDGFLMQAAPDLLKELRRLVDLCDPHGNEPDWLAPARAAICRAMCGDA